MKDVTLFAKEYYQLIMIIALFIMPLIWLKLDSRYAKSEIKNDVHSLNKRIDSLEYRFEQMPTISNFNELEISIESLRGELKTIHNDIKGFKHLVNLLIAKEIKEKQ